MMRTEPEPPASLRAAERTAWKSMVRRKLARLSHRAFQVGVVLKGVDGVLELLGSAALLLTTQTTIRRAVSLLTNEELAEDPRDYLANHVVHMAQQLSLRTQHFAAIYLFAHGAIKIVLVVGLLRGLRWSYPAALLVLTAFIGYQLYRLAYLPSLGLYVLTALDLAVVLLIWREWRHARAWHDKP
ncbi:MULTISPECIES: DUF2127 domain-containing protein [Rhodanobacter]|nr:MULTISPECIES: DUF2127 domain-containing protein [Rhodanobacter]UJJ52760.1 DUF2127 domain-containing protein [Rhodanobacter denitrificans]UJM95531.1 DUF2127 domain-containing protein [Rhodanobacter denitrificans]UJM99062.1 DUF2127 domain-containing protein [Rhodanobacter denitrificans]UJN21523.1 DUF2127 domain-containing protein [Rhodanobacter denitrificans]